MKSNDSSNSLPTENTKPRVFARLLSREITLEESHNVSGAKDEECEYTNDNGADFKCPF